MSAFSRFRRAVDARHGVGDVRLADSYGVSSSGFYRRTALEGWSAPAAGVRVTPDASPSVQVDVLVACAATTALAAAAGLTAAWLHGLVLRPPSRSQVCIAHRGRAPSAPRTEVRRARWLHPSDAIELHAVPVLDATTTLLSCAHLDPHTVRALLIDATFKGLTDPEEVVSRLASVGPLPGRRVLLRAARDLRGRDVESPFHDEVVDELTRLGYGPTRSATRIATPDGRDLVVDIPLPRWCVAVEPEGDAFHRDREARRRDRRRTAAYAGSPWVPVPIDWRDWHADREHVLTSIDAAIERQRAIGIGTAHPPPTRRTRPSA